MASRIAVTGRARGCTIMGKAIRLFIGLLFFVGMTYSMITTELDNMNRADMLMKSGVVTVAAVDDAEISTTRVYFIPVNENGRLDYHFRTQSGQEIAASQTVRADAVLSLSADGSTYRKGTPIAVSYLANDPETNLPFSELQDQAGFHWIKTTLYCGCFALFGLVGPVRMRRWATEYSQRRMNKTLSDLHKPDATDAELSAAMQRMLQKAQAEAPYVPPVQTATRAPAVSNIAPRMMPKAGGAARPAFGKRA